MSSTPSAARRWPLRLATLAGLLVLALAWFGAPSQARAAASCSASISSVNLGSTLSPLTAGNVDATANLNFSCTGLTPLLPVSLCPNLDAGSGGSNGAGQRYMAGPGGATVPFQIYQDSGRTQPWGSSVLLVFGTVPTITANPGTGSSINVNQTVYLRLSTSTTTLPGTYSTSFTGQTFFWGLNLLSCAGVTVGSTLTPATFTFSATLIADCTITTGNLNFGNVGVLSANKDAQTGMSVTCTKDTPYAIGLDNGQQGTSATARRMKAASQYVTYGIYKDEARGSPWGTGAGLTVGGSGTGATQPLTLYGRVPAQTTPSPATYGDQVIATVTY
ncbi:spore coat protein U domain-containing protein [Caulobacter sp. 602-2]|uniref:Spore coat protein U domain-containing protein n=1 Tax=Caulobacter sp. 602-2 TaxID=2710887 RepID=A0A6G4QUV0_9CAUL|nr:spore coat U domain-containing protein [Caulobacter sp. 602-2]NGM48728.1 spore coat protein U domain-containing protein [Caulobacter sp. 602-2]